MAYFPLSSLFLPLPFSYLDLSFNHIQVIERLEGAVSLQKLFLIQNKITKIENLSCLTTLTMLELGSNRIRVRDPVQYEPSYLPFLFPPSLSFSSPPFFFLLSPLLPPSLPPFLPLSLPFSHPLSR